MTTIVSRLTRNVVGSMDHTPMAFHSGVLPNSEAAEVGLGVVYESGLNVLGGSIAAYQARPQAQRFLRQLPAVWDETRLLAGDPANGATIARRSGGRWVVGAVYQGAARTLSVPTAFLGSGSWLVETITDGPQRADPDLAYGHRGYRAQCGDRHQRRVRRAGLPGHRGTDHLRQLGGPGRAGHRPRSVTGHPGH